MNRIHKLALAAAVSAVVSLAGTATADQIIYDSLPAGSIQAERLLRNFDSFSTGGSSTFLTNIKLVFDGDPNGTGIISVNLLSNELDNPLWAQFLPGNSSPGATLVNIGTLDVSLLLTTPSVFAFPLVTPYLLAPNTRYWVEVDGTQSDGTARWDVVDGDPNIWPGVPNEFFANVFGPPGYIGGVVPNDLSPYQMQVNVRPTPEPSSVISLGGCVAVGLIGYCWRRRQSLKGIGRPIDRS